jgi:hypothetical protein
VNRHEQEQFIDKEVRGLWPKWKPTDAEITVWMRELAAFEYGPAQRAVQAYFAEQMVHAHRPLLGRFLAKARVLAKPTTHSPRQGGDVTTDVFLDCLESPKDNPHWAGVRKPVYVWPSARQSDPDYVMACAESMRKRFELIYGGRWIVVRTRPAQGSPPASPPR